MRETTYVATEFAGDPPEAISRWYKIQAGTYARVADGKVEIFSATELKTEISVGTSIQFVEGESDSAEVELVDASWALR